MLIQCPRIEKIRDFYSEMDGNFYSMEIRKMSLTMRNVLSVSALSTVTISFGLTLPDSAPPKTNVEIDIYISARDTEEVIVIQGDSDDTDKATEPTSSVSKDSDSGSLFRDGRSKETKKTKENKNVPADSLTSNANPVSKNREDSGLLFQDGR